MTQITQATTEPTRNSAVERAQVIELTPAIDVYENEKELLLIADLPNVTPDALNIEVNHPDLSIQGRVAATDSSPERLYTRSFRLDSSLDVAKIEAKLSDGVLKVHLPKSEPYRVRKIEVKGS